MGGRRRGVSCGACDLSYGDRGQIVVGVGVSLRTHAMYIPLVIRTQIVILLGQYVGWITVVSPRGRGVACTAPKYEPPPQF